MSFNSDIQIERVDDYSREIAAGMGLLMPFLSEKLDNQPIPESRLRPIIDSPDSDQIIARRGELIMGSAVLSLMRGNNGAGVKGWLEDFVVHPDERGKGTSDVMADYWEEWYRQNGAKILHFTSGWDRQPAHNFYFKRGAKIMNESGRDFDPTAFFYYPIIDKV